MSSSSTTFTPSYPHFSIPIFTGELFEHWRDKMETLLRSQDLWNLVRDGVPPGKAAEGAVPKPSKEDAKKDALALHIIQQGVSTTIYPRIMGSKTSHEAWVRLEDEYKGNKKVLKIKIQSLRRQFDAIMMKEGETSQEYFAKLTGIANQVRSLGGVLEESQIVEKILRSLTKRYNHIVAAIMESHDIEEMSVTELLGSLQSHEDLLCYDSAGLEKAFQTKVSFRNKSEERKKFTGYKNSQHPKQKRPGDREVSKHKEMTSTSLGCIICKKQNHATKDCFWRCKTCKIQNHSEKNCWFKPKQEVKTEAKVTEISDDQFLFTCKKSEINDSPTVWFIDSGCSNHMVNNLAYFISFDESFKSEVTLGDGKKEIIEGKGTASVITMEGVQKFINEVQYVPTLAHNLLSVGQLLRKGYKIVFDHKKCHIYRPQSNSAVATAHINSSNIFTIDLKPNKNFSLACTENKLTQLWHYRLGHLNLHSLYHMHQNQLVDGLPKITKTEHHCDTCARSKSHRQPFPLSAQRRASQPLDLLHMDLWGPASTPSLGGKRYFLLIVDDYSRYMWIMHLEQKSDSFLQFKAFKQQVEKQLERHIKTLRSDRGGEFLSTNFNTFCQDAGIHRELTAPGSPQQNGVVERRNRTIMEMARSMVIQKALPKAFWAEAATTAVYLLNRVPTKALQQTTPYEALFKQKPSVAHIKVFGSIAYAHKNIEKHDKLDETSQKCILLGYSEQTKGYRLLEPRSGKLIISRDAIFHEEEAWVWENQGASDKEPYQFVQPLPVELETTPNPIQDSGVIIEPEHYDSESPSSLPKKYRSLKDIYQTEEVAMLTTTPTTFEEAAKDKNWKEAMQLEIKAIQQNKTWSLVDKPKNHVIIGLKWVYKLKQDEDGNIQKYKARLVAKGYSQKQGEDYDETYAPVARMTTIRLILSFAAQYNYPIYQLDVKSAFLNGELTEEVYVQQPQGFEKKDEEEKVYRLHKALYGLKQAPRAWHQNIDAYFIKEGFIRSSLEPTLYIKTSGKDKTLISLYVDDLIVTGSSPVMIQHLKQSMKNHYEMTDLGTLKFFLGLQVKQMTGSIFLSQEAYVKALLTKYQMENSNPVITPMTTTEKLYAKTEEEEATDKEKYRSLVGSLIYLTNTRPDIENAVNILARFVSNPSIAHANAAKRVLRYLQGTRSYGVHYQYSQDNSLKGFTDSDWAGSIDDRKSTGGFIFFVGSSPISWSSRKQRTVALSSTEAEYMALNSAACEAIWLHRLKKEIEGEGKEDTEGVKIHCDNSSAIALSKNPIYHGRSKHIELRYHFIRELLEKKEVELLFCPTRSQLADILTKPLPRDRFLELRKKIGVINNTDLEGV
ncbi:hypothetical protein KSP39_PZI020059 [Platanthera zijinensis]|uniref:Integrase catalytic domain-containing protein n=1 Tax=Platanthera zijinensis TaxID=2320716 RepID=A0AAP0FWH7_9ASPA